MQKPNRIVVVGATGYTGKLVARELSGGVEPVLLTARDPERLQALAREVGAATTRIVDVAKAETLAGALRGGDVVVNCAGPFSDLGEPVVEACIAAGAHYLDITGEQRFMKRVYDRFHGAAQDAGLVVVNGMAFEYAIGDCAAALAASRLSPPLRSVDLFYAWHGGVRTSSRGTRRSVLRVIRDGGYAYANGRWSHWHTGAQRETVRLPGGKRRPALWFPAGEILTVPRHQQVRTVRGWIVIGSALAAALPRIAPVLPRLVSLVEPLSEWHLRRAPEGPRPEQRRRSRFLICAVAIGSDGDQACINVDGANPYELTATIVAHAARRLLRSAPSSTGVLAPAQLLDPADFLSMLSAHDLTWDDSCLDSARH
jgi:short subunit dehydrogenase-like uncharacterized protein